MRAPFLCRGTDACCSNRRKQDRNGTASAIGRAYLALQVQSAPGFDVYPREIEDVLFEHPAVVDAGVIGVPVGGQDQQAKAFIVLKDGAAVDEEELIEFCRERLARYKIPRPSNSAMNRPTPSLARCSDARLWLRSKPRKDPQANSSPGTQRLSLRYWQPEVLPSCRDERLACRTQPGPLRRVPSRSCQNLPRSQLR